jgi:hypothetical protein
MFRCPVCRAISQQAGECGVCGGVVREIQGNSFVEPARQKVRQFWSRAKILALTALVLVSISSLGTGLYLMARPGPTCKNYAVNYPSCNDCGPLAAISPSTDSCSCTNSITSNWGTSQYQAQALNPPKCNKFCANNAVNPPKCDLCYDNQTDITCPPANTPPAIQVNNSLLTAHSLTQPSSPLESYSFTPISANAPSNI